MKVTYGKNELEAYRGRIIALSNGMCRINIPVRKVKRPEYQYGWQANKKKKFGGHFNVVLHSGGDYHEPLRTSTLHFSPMTEEEAVILQHTQIFERVLKWELELLLLPDYVIYPEHYSSPKER